jgi:hypothetical protein
LGKTILFKKIGNFLAQYIDKEEPKEKAFTCASIYVEENMENGIPEAIFLTLDNWKHNQPIDYEQLPFKCKSFHEYKHFSKDCKKTNPQILQPVPKQNQPIDYE